MVSADLIKKAKRAVANPLCVSLIITFIIMLILVTNKTSGCIKVGLWVFITVAISMSISNIFIMEGIKEGSDTLAYSSLLSHVGQGPPADGGVAPLGDDNNLIVTT